MPLRGGFRPVEGSIGYPPARSIASQWQVGLSSADLFSARRYHRAGRVVALLRGDAAWYTRLCIGRLSAYGGLDGTATAGTSPDPHSPERGIFVAQREKLHWELFVPVD